MYTKNELLSKEVSMSFFISKVKAYEILDSRGNPTVEVKIFDVKVMSEKLLFLVVLQQENMKH